MFGRILLLNRRSLKFWRRKSCLFEWFDHVRLSIYIGVHESSTILWTSRIQSLSAI